MLEHMYIANHRTKLQIFIFFHMKLTFFLFTSMDKGADKPHSKCSTFTPMYSYTGGGSGDQHIEEGVYRNDLFEAAINICPNPSQVN